MLAIRMQRTGRKGHAQFRVIVQDSRFSASSGRVVAYLGNYNPHTKTATLDGERTAKYLENGAQPSDRVARLFKSEGINLPKWVSISSEKKKDIKNIDKLRRNKPEEAKEESAVETPAEKVEEVPKETKTESAEKVEEPEA